MSRTILPIFLGSVLVTLALVGCGKAVYLGGQAYAALPDSVAVRIIDATGVTRRELEGVLREHEILARFHVMVTSSEHYDEELARELEKKTAEARLLGGRVLMHTRDSELVATIAHDARYAGPSGAVVIYVLRRR